MTIQIPQEVENAIATAQLAHGTYMHTGKSEDRDCAIAAVKTAEVLSASILNQAEDKQEAKDKLKAETPRTVDDPVEVLSAMILVNFRYKRFIKFSGDVKIDAKGNVVSDNYYAGKKGNHEDISQLLTLDSTLEECEAVIANTKPCHDKVANINRGSNDLIIKFA